ncbi:MAG: orotidine-5'-phosphate decarboxylase, partial [Planctomycetota bacterium]
MNFADRLTAAIESKGTPAMVGLDPRYESLPRELRRGESPERAEVADAFLEFSRRVIDVVAPLVPVVKPNLAFFEAQGWEGFRAYEAVVAHAKERGLIVVADAKRGDIGSTAEAYARAIFEEIGADAVTLSPYLGSDSLNPFFTRLGAGRGVFILVKTSNPSGAELQDLETASLKVHEAVADLVNRWGEPHVGECGYRSVGAVVGATYPEQAATLRARMPRVPFLLPGYGAQGGKAEALRRAFGDSGRGAVVNSSRGIIFAHAREPYASEY